VNAETKLDQSRRFETGCSSSPFSSNFHEYTSSSIFFHRIDKRGFGQRRRAQQAHQQVIHT
jgi:hypothetical protein